MSPRIVADTSSLLTLELVDLLDRIAFVDLATVGRVVSELEDLAGFDDEEAAAAERVLSWIDGGGIEVFSLQATETMEALASKRVQPAEAACLQACREAKAEVLVTDDARAIAGLRDEAMAHGIRLRISVAVIVESRKRGELSTTQARRLVDEIIDARGWEGGVLEVLARRHLDR
jgi:predicted nucleic acid-binding protein